MLRGFLFIAAAGTMLTACNLKSQTTSEVEAAAGNSRNRPIVLEAGLYRAQIEMPGTCRDKEINVTQRFEYSNGNSSRQATIWLAHGGAVIDDLNHPQICQQTAVDTGTTIIEATKKFSLRVEGRGAKIKALERITETKEIAISGSALAAGAYIVQLSKPIGCMPEKFTPVQRLKFQFGSNSMEATTVFTSGVTISSNVMRPQMCAAPNSGIRDTGMASQLVPAGSLTRFLAVENDLKIEKLLRVDRAVTLLSQ
jgi:hypothetical protein